MNSKSFNIKNILPDNLLVDNVHEYKKSTPQWLKKISEWKNKKQNKIVIIDPVSNMPINIPNIQNVKIFLTKQQQSQNNKLFSNIKKKINILKEKKKKQVKQRRPKKKSVVVKM
jgi:hypothetical protein